MPSKKRCYTQFEGETAGGQRRFMEKVEKELVLELRVRFEWGQRVGRLQLEQPSGPRGAGVMS